LVLKIFAWSCPIPDDLTEASINTESAAIVRKIQPEMPFHAVWLRTGTVADNTLTYFEEGTSHPLRHAFFLDASVR